MSKLINILKPGDQFIDDELDTEYDVDLTFSTIGDHVYSITDRRANIVIARDIGNSHGIVIANIAYE